MAVNLCAWILTYQVLKQRQKRRLLLLRSRVFCGFHIGRLSTYIADPYTGSVLAGAVCASYRNVAPWFYCTVKVYYVVVAYIVKSARFVPAAYIGSRIVTPLRRIRAVDYYLLYISHSVA